MASSFGWLASPCGCRALCGDDGDSEGPGVCKGLPVPPREPLVKIVFVDRRAAHELGWCGNKEPHEGHEFIDGVFRRDCPGICLNCRGTGRDGGDYECSLCDGAGCA